MRVKQDIPKLTVLGKLQYNYEFTFGTIHEDQTMQQILASNESFETVRLPLKKINPGFPVYLHKINPTNLKGIENKLSEIEIGLWNITKVDDQENANVYYQYCYLNGWPEIFILSNKDIKKGETLYAYKDPKIWTTITCKKL